MLYLDTRLRTGCCRLVVCHPFVTVTSPVPFFRFPTAMAMLSVSRSTSIRPALCSLKGAEPSSPISARIFPLQRTNFQKNRWRIACAGTDFAREWRRECSELRVEIHELQEALADTWIQDEIQLLELEKLVSAVVDVYARTPQEAGSVEPRVEQSSAAHDRELAVTNFADGRNEDKASEISLESDGADDNAVMLSELRSEELRAKQEGLSTLRRLKTLNVHEYVHNALQASHLRSWLKSRGIAE